MVEISIIVFIAIAGLMVGSFLNVVILRLKAGKQFIKGRSACPHCKHTLGVLELVPVLSWLALRGRCRHCKKPIAIQYPLVELLTAILFVAAYLRADLQGIGDVINLVLWLYIIASLIVLAVYDLRWYLLPDKVLLPIIVPAGAIMLNNAVMYHSASAIYSPLAAAILFGGFFYLLAWVSKGRWMGGGDIKLAFVMGLLLGLQNTALAMLIAFNTAALVAILLIMLKRKQRKDTMPFGPFLIGGTIVAYLYGNGIITWYLNISGVGSLI